MSGYDRAISIFSPDGHIFQVDYANEAVNKGTLTLALKSKNCIIIASEVRSSLKLQATTTSKIHRLTDSIGMVTSGLSADARVLIKKAKVECESYEYNMDSTVTVDYIAKFVADTQQKYTQSGGVRPFGVGCLIAGLTEDGEGKIYKTDPSGVYQEWHCCSIGKNAKTVQSYLEKNIDMLKQNTLTKFELLKFTVESLLEIVSNGSQNMEICLIDKENGLNLVSKKTIDDIIESIEKEREDADNQ
ncbi:related to Proteasome subunit alpha type-4 [Hanseniaspora guilliermondii]|uniref:Related to Proteasome subunit alpha type-4 n=1 Tax=Hanseniaspora guilliermondii TaxID=56406 RepID=A0A1L0CHV5_9ASCO|nr:related to Proteasome subunit alpha type-4 [Hanseniaspora guilliermondii]